MTEGIAGLLAGLASTAMFAAVASALAWGLGMRRHRLPRLWMTVVCSLVFCCAAVVVETLSPAALRYQASLATLAVALTAFTAYAVAGAGIVRATALVSCLFTLTGVRGVITTAYQSLPLEQILPTDVSSLVFYTVVYAAYAAVSSFFAKNPLRSATLLPARGWAILIVPPAIVAVASQAELAIYGLDDSTRLMSLAFQGLALLSMVSLYGLAVITTRAYDKLLEERSVSQRLSLTLDHVERSGVIAEQVRRDKHEMKNILFYIQSLVRSGHLEELAAFLDAEVTHFDGLTEFHTGNDLLDYLLTQKGGELRAIGAKTYFDVAVPTCLAIDGRDLCGLLSNLLDNAIDASRTEAEPEVRLIIREVKGYLSIKVSNRCSHDVLAHNPHLRTTKKAAAEHGIGLRVVRSIVEKHNGIFRASMEDGHFVASALLELG